MTLVQASLANNGKCVILVADRLLTRSFGENFPSYEFEWNRPKIMSKGRVGIGFAGSAMYADIAGQFLADEKRTKDLLVQRQILTDPKEKFDLNDFDNIVTLLEVLIGVFRTGAVEGTIQRMTGVSSQDFFTNPELPVPEQVRDYIYGWHSEFNLQFECIVTGFDRNDEPQIVVMTDNGSPVNVTNFGAVSIGSGSVFSQIYFDQENFDISLSENEGLFFAYKAKKWAEAPTGVGHKTDLILLRKTKSRSKVDIHDDDPLMQELDRAHIKQKENINKAEEKILEHLTKNSSGRLK